MPSTGPLQRVSGGRGIAAQSARVTHEQQYDLRRRRSSRGAASTPRTMIWLGLRRDHAAGPWPLRTARLGGGTSRCHRAVGTVQGPCRCRGFRRTGYPRGCRDGADGLGGDETRPTPDGSRHRPDAELAETFFNSVTRRVFSTVGVDPAIEYLDLMSQPPQRTTLRSEKYSVARSMLPLVRQILLSVPWTVPYAQLQRDAALVAELIEGRSVSTPGGLPRPHGARHAPVGLLPEQGSLPGGPSPGEGRGVSR